MRVRINMKSDPISLTILAASGYEHKKMDEVGHDGIVEAGIIEKDAEQLSTDGATPASLPQGAAELACWPIHAVATACNVGMIGIAASRCEYGFMWTAFAAACYTLSATIRNYQANAGIERPQKPQEGRLT